MKGFALVLLCAFAAVNARSSGVSSSSVVLAQRGENPWFVHMRIAIGTSGFLDTCAGSLIGNAWILTSASCVDDARFIWLRYGAVDVLSPEVVTESNNVRLHPDFNAATNENNVALISINRVVHSTANIGVVAVSENAEIPASANFCSYGQNEDGSPADRLGCFDVSLEASDNVVVASSEAGAASVHDIGAPLVVDGQQVGILVGASADNAGVFVNVAQYRSWIEQTTGLDLGSVSVQEHIEAGEIKIVSPTF